MLVYKINDDSKTLMAYLHKLVPSFLAPYITTRPIILFHFRLRQLGMSDSRLLLYKELFVNNFVDGEVIVFCCEAAGKI